MGGVAQQQQNCEATDHADRHRDRGNKRSAQTAKKEKYDDDHESEGDPEGDQHIVDGIRNEGRRVVVHNVLEARRKLSAQAVHSGPYQGGGLDRVGAWGQIDAQSNRGPTVDTALHVLILGAELHPGDVADAQQRAIEDWRATQCSRTVRAGGPASAG